MFKYQAVQTKATSLRTMRTTTTTTASSSSAAATLDNQTEECEKKTTEEDGTLYADSVKRKRVKKMNKHKYKKRMKAQRRAGRKVATQ